MKRVLVLGSGLVSAPLVRYLLGPAGAQVTVATRTVARAEALLAGHPQGRAIALDVSDEEELGRLIGESDLTISLLPYTHHALVARHCLAHRRHMVTTSYVQPAIQELDTAARVAGVLFLNEIGLDPGLDHMSAMRTIHAVQAAGGEVAGFTSYCGGLPAPEANTNPLGYKFSWSPRGVLLAGRNAARFLRDDKIVEVRSGHLFRRPAPVAIAGVGTFEGYPNRDSLPYLERYGIASAKNIFRGTLRYPGWCDALQTWGEAGLLDDTPRNDLAGLSWGRLVGRLIGIGERIPSRQELADRLGRLAQDALFERWEWLGLLSEEPLPVGAPSVLDALVARMQSLMGYAPSERDMVILQDTFAVRYGGRREEITTSLIEYGEPGGDSAMARTVGLPAAIAARLILEGQIHLTGVQIPVQPAIYRPVLAELELAGICFHEQRRAG